MILSSYSSRNVCLTEKTLNGIGVDRYLLLPGQCEVASDLFGQWLCKN
jgi:hypothetical protein